MGAGNGLGREGPGADVYVELRVSPLDYAIAISRTVLPLVGM